MFNIHITTINYLAVVRQSRFHISVSGRSLILFLPCTYGIYLQQTHLHYKELSY
jgi:hypothetical protein